MEVSFYSWLFVIMVLIAVPSVTFVINSTTKNLRKYALEKKNEEEFQFARGREQTKMFIYNAFAHVIPIVLNICAYIQLDKAMKLGMTKEMNFSTLNEIFIIVLIWIFGIISIVKCSSSTNSILTELKSTKQTFNTLMYIGIALVSAIPMIGIIGLLIR